MIDKIKAEIERLIDEDGKYYAEDALYKLLSFIESLEKDQPEGLEEAAKEFSARQNYPVHAYGGFIAGVKWLEETRNRADSERMLVKSKGSTIKEAWINAFDLLQYRDEYIPADKVKDEYIIAIELNKPSRKANK